ncbi:MAG: SPOR domain-containing protein, partial [Bacteroidota bacterium]
TGRKTFHLIAGSFNRFDQASEFSSALRSKGYSPLIIFPETGISETFRVSVYQSTLRAKVDEFKVKFNQGGGSAWVYTQ